LASFLAQKNKALTREALDSKLNRRAESSYIKIDNSKVAKAHYFKECCDNFLEYPPKYKAG
jgi:hypothetical protein